MRRRLAIVVACLPLVFGVAVAIAYFTTSGAGSASATIAALSAPGVTVPATAVNTVTVGWGTSSVGLAPALDTEVTYVVERSANAGGTWTATAGTCAGTKASTVHTCDDTLPGTGSYLYRVTGQFRSWTAASVSAPVSATVLVAPTLTSKPAATSAAIGPSFAWGAVPGATGYECKLDLGVFGTCASPKSYASLATGSHTFTVRALAGALPGPATAYTWTINTTAPAITANPPASTTSTSASFSFTHGVYTQFECKLDAGAFGACTSPQGYSSLTSGSHTFSVHALDANGIATPDATYTWTITGVPVNTAAPTVSGIVAEGNTLTTTNGTWTNSPTSFAYQWQRCTTTTCTSVAGATSQTYLVSSADVDYALRAQVTATNPGGPSAPASSANTTVVDHVNIATAVLGGGPINALAQLADGSTILGGSFTTIGPPRHGLAIDLTTDTTISQHANTNGAINAVVADGSGGWIVGGSFTSINGALRNNLAQLDTAGNVTSWNPDVNGTVSALAASGTTVYVGGTFSQAATVTRNNIAAYTLSTGALASFNANANGSVLSLAVAGTSVFLGGTFATVGGTTRPNLAKVDSTTGALAVGFNANADGAVLALAVTSSELYVGGQFSNIGGGSGARVERILQSDGTQNGGFNPGTTTNGEVRALAYDSAANLLYVGGTFTTLAGTVGRNRLGVLMGSNANVQNWIPNPDGAVNALAVSGTGSTARVYAGGTFLNAGGAARARVAAISASSPATAFAWAPSTSDAINALAVDGSKVYVAGATTTIAGTARNYLAKVDAAGTLTAWNPAPDLPVNALLASGANVYVGGQFTSIGAISRTRLALVNTTTGAGVTTFNANVVDNTVRALALSGVTLYAGGDFTTVGSATHTRLAQVNATTGAVSATWTASATGTVNALSLVGTTLYAGGAFATLAGQSRANVGAVGTADPGAATTWNPGTSATVNALVATPTAVYAGGTFTTAGGQARLRLAALDPASNTATSFNPGADAAVNALALSNDTLYAGGAFATLGGQNRPQVGAVSTTTGTTTAWSPPQLGAGALNALAATSGGPLVIGGGLFALFN